MLQDVDAPPRAFPSKWSTLARVRAYVRKSGPEACRKKMVGPIRAELALILAETLRPADREEVRAEIQGWQDHCCKCCKLCRLGRP